MNGELPPAIQRNRKNPPTRSRPTNSTELDHELSTVPLQGRVLFLALKGRAGAVAEELEQVLVVGQADAGAEGPGLGDLARRALALGGDVAQ